MRKRKKVRKTGRPSKLTAQVSLSRKRSAVRALAAWRSQIAAVHLQATRAGRCLGDKRKKVRKTGRPSKLTAQVTKAIVEALKAGNYAEVAAEHAGISARTFYTWKAKGESGQPPYAQFLHSIVNSEAFAETRAITVISNAMLQDWKAAAWFLERGRQTRWGKRVELAGKDGGPIDFSLTFDRRAPAGQEI